MMYTEDSKRWAVDGSLQRAEGREQRAASRGQWAERLEG